MDATDENGNTPAHLAAREGLFLCHTTPLHARVRTACTWVCLGHGRALQLLAKAGANFLVVRAYMHLKPI